MIKTGKGCKYEYGEHLFLKDGTPVRVRTRLRSCTAQENRYWGNFSNGLEWAAYEGELSRKAPDMRVSGEED